LRRSGEGVFCTYDHAAQYFDQVVRIVKCGFSFFRSLARNGQDGAFDRFDDTAIGRIGCFAQAANQEFGCQTGLARQSDRLAKSQFR